jgi:nitrite reductase/ring-hydroxylating ferredoxin subunit
MAEWMDAAAADDVVEDAVIGTVVNGIALALFRIGEEVFALHDQCSHGMARLSEGYVEDGCVECPLHQGLVDIRTGAARTAPISIPVDTYPARVRDGRVEVEV